MNTITRFVAALSFSSFTQVRFAGRYYPALSKKSCPEGTKGLR
ncbi:MAG: hypothetical protein RR288_02235 [Oscillibacter sp.]